MKIFFYKAVLIFILFIAAFHFSFGYAIKKAKIELQNTISKEKIEELKSKVRKEMLSASEKENYINPEDAEIINKFFKKVISDLEKNK